MLLTMLPTLPDIPPAEDVTRDRPCETFSIWPLPASGCPAFELVSVVALRTLVRRNEVGNRERRRATRDTAKDIARGVLEGGTWEGLWVGGLVDRV